MRDNEPHLTGLGVTVRIGSGGFHDDARVLGTDTQWIFWGSGESTGNADDSPSDISVTKVAWPVSQPSVDEMA